MASSKDVAIIFSCCLFFHGLSKAACGDLGKDDRIAIGVSLGLTAFILLFLGFFLCRALKTYTTDTRDNPSITETGSVSMMPLPSYNSPSLTETGRASLENPANINKAWVSYV
ncbi:uncharacterized protein [Porites lutea]|uniref:uncharacterized protein n=1 Tax=Porites lutea TaxID=51062 RepID=UPI003CC5757C